jgi:endoglucanase Acf2
MIGLYSPAHGTSYFNEFNAVSENLAQRLYIYEIEDNATTSLLQIISPASQNVATDISLNLSTPHQITSFSDSSISFSEVPDRSVTVAYLMSDMYDVVSGKIVLMTPL